MTTISEAENIQRSYNIIFIRRIILIRFLHRRNYSRGTENVIALCERTFKTVIQVQCFVDEIFEFEFEFGI